MQKHVSTVEGWVRRVGAWANQAETWQVIAVVALALLALPLAPALMLLVVLGALSLMVRAWLREIAYLMELGDDAFPGRDDKRIWAILLIVLPPVGTYLFRSYRVAHWPESEPKPAAPACDLS